MIRKRHIVERILLCCGGTREGDRQSESGRSLSGSGKEKNIIPEAPDGGESRAIRGWEERLWVFICGEEIGRRVNKSLFSATHPQMASSATRGAWFERPRFSTMSVKI